MPFLRLYSGEKFQEQWELTDRMRIGRARDNEILLPSPHVSKHHAWIERQGSGFVLFDNKSSNGVFVNGNRVTRHALNFWDQIRIHPYRLTFMAVGKLPGEEEGVPVAPEQMLRLKTEAHASATQVVRSEDLARQLNALARAPVATLIRVADGTAHSLGTGNLTLGRGAENDVRCGGWFAPRVAALIQRRANGYYLVPERRGRIRVNGVRSDLAVHLKDRDLLEIQGVAFEYREGPPGAA